MVRRRGQTMVEFALLAPGVFLLLFGLIDLGVAAYTYATVTHGTQAAAMYASLHCSYSGTGYTTTQLSQQVIQAGTLLQAANLSLSATPASHCTAPGTAITLTSTYTYHPLTPMIQMLVPSSGISLQVSAQVLAQ